MLSLKYLLKNVFYVVKQYLTLLKKFSVRTTLSKTVIVTTTGSGVNYIAFTAINCKRLIYFEFVT